VSERKLFKQKRFISFNQVVLGSSPEGIPLEQIVSDCFRLLAVKALTIPATIWNHLELSGTIWHKRKNLAYK
jgi:hypothetical protein